MVRRGNDHRIDLRIGQQLPVIHIRFHFRVETALDALLPVWPIDVANRYHLHIGRVNDRIDQVPAAGSQADATHANRFAGGFG